MHLPTLIPLATAALLASANAAFFPPLFPTALFPTAVNPVGPIAPTAVNPVGSIVSTALASVSSIPSAVAPVVASAVAAVPAIPNNASSDSIPGLGIAPSELYDHILAAIAIEYTVLKLLNFSGMADIEIVKNRDLNQILKSRDLDLPIGGLTGLEAGGSLGYTVTTLLGLTIPLLSTEVS